MKTLKNKTTGVIKRVSDKEAHQMVSASYLGWDTPQKQYGKKTVNLHPQWLRVTKKVMLLMKLTTICLIRK